MRKHRSKRNHYDPDKPIDAQSSPVPNQNPQSTTENKNSDNWFVTRYLLAVVLSIGGVFVFLPKVFSIIPNKIVAVIAVLFLIPAVRITTDLIFEEGSKPTIRDVIRKYFILLFSLTFQLAMIPLIIMPIVALGLAAVFGAMGIAVGVIFIGLWLLQCLGYQVGRELPFEEVKLMLMITVGLSIYEGIFYLGYRWVNSFKRSIFDILADMFLGVTDWLDKKI